MGLRVPRLAGIAVLTEAIVGASPPVRQAQTVSREAYAIGALACPPNPSRALEKLEMPNYKVPQYFHQNSASTFDEVHAPGSIAPASGVYRCESCGFEAVSTQGHRLPPELNCVHHSAAWICNAGRVLWRLVAAAIHRSS